MSLTKVLVVDDEDDIAWGIATRLRFAGYDVLTACDGVEAVKMAVEELPDLVILDIGLPDLDGHAVARNLQTLDATASTSIIYLTARTAIEDRTRAYETGAIAYLTKPYRSPDLLSAVERAATATRNMRCENNVEY